MRNNRNTLLALVILFILAIIAWLFYIQQEKHFKWYETYSRNGDEPYDLSLFYNTLSDTYGEENLEILTKPIDSTFADQTKTTFLYIGQSMYGLDSVAVDHLTDFAREGNTVFLSCSWNPFLHRFFEPCMEVEEYWPVDDHSGKYLTLHVNGQIGPDAKIFFASQNDPQHYTWNYFNTDDTCMVEGLEQAGTFRNVGYEMVNFLKYSVGSGAIYLHSTPLAFTNYHLRDTGVFSYVSTLTELMNSEKFVVYDPQNFGSFNGSPHVVDSPLRFILKNPPLRWAWYILIAAVLIYTINGMRRKQKAIPVFNLPRNETATYLDVVSKLYLKEGRHKHVLQIREKLLRRYLINKHRLPAHDLTDTFFAEAELKLKIPQQEIRSFFKKLERAKNNSTLTDEEFHKIDQEITEFYQKCQ